MRASRSLRSWEIGRLASDLSELGGVALKRKRYPDAPRLLRESLEIGQQFGLKAQMADSLHRLGQLAQVQGDTEWAVSLLVATIRLYGELSSPKAGQVQADLELLREAVGEEQFSAFQAQAEQRSTEEVLSSIRSV